MVMLVREVLPPAAVELEVKFVPVIVMVTGTVLPAGAPGGQIPLAAIVGIPELTVRVTLITRPLLAAFEEATVTVPLYGVTDGATPVASAVIVRVSGRPINATLPVGDAFSQVPPETVTVAVRASPLVARITGKDCAIGVFPVV